ncbi:MAG: carbohydrate kinase [Treponema sp.]|jgi:fructokinase|nr:carbohydrate kinase [Treponema sp.]
MILACGEALIDMVPRTSPEGETLFLPCPGGSPYNTAIAIGRLGASVAFLGRLSTDFFGETLIDRLSQNKIHTGFIVRSQETSTLAFVKLEKGREPQYVFYTQGSADRSLTQADLPASLPPEARCILFGSISLTMEPVASSIEALIRREGGRGKDAPVISLDPNVRPFMIPDTAAYVKRFEGWAACSTIVKVSEADFDFIYPGLGLEKSLEKVLSMGPRLAVATLGPGGALALLKREDGTTLRVTAPVVKVPVVDTIGAGDAFHGAFLAWLELRGLMSRQAIGALAEGDLYNALFFANKAASLVCSRQGAEPPTLAETEALA